jgi:hypothetical protein
VDSFYRTAESWSRPWFLLADFEGLSKTNACPLQSLHVTAGYASRKTQSVVPFAQKLSTPHPPNVASLHYHPHFLDGAAVDKILDALSSRHTPTCPWVVNACPASVMASAWENPHQIFSDYSERLVALSSLEALPRLDSSFFLTNVQPPPLLCACSADAGGYSKWILVVVSEFGPLAERLWLAPIHRQRAPPPQCALTEESPAVF